MDQRKQRIEKVPTTRALELSKRMGFDLFDTKPQDDYEKRTGKPVERGGWQN